MGKVRVIAVWGAAVVAVVASAPGAGAVGPEPDLAYHGEASMAAGRVDVRFTALHHGHSAGLEATVRLSWSVPLADRQSLPGMCARSGPQTVVCRTGALPADGWGERIALSVRLRGKPSEVTLQLDTVWNGAADRNRANHQQRVLVLDTGDTYRF
ncbi:hypothetical protein ABZV31_33530 [Streptomyces sp. NPDC005202]|uniref:hypothetical protein n=1 Tax=Streptomyces sp. NPDC005202 TaxID=3157021 RepID=UPI0033AAAD67